MAGGEVLDDLPPARWPTLLRAVRRATDRMDRSALPVALRPFSGWKPERLAAAQPRRVIAAALAADPVLREAVGESLDDAALFADAETLDSTRLVERYGEDAAIAGLAVRGRWDDLAVVAAASAERLAAVQRSAAEAAQRHGDAADLAARRRLTEELSSARGDRDAYRRRAEGAEQRERAAAAERRRLADQVEALQARIVELSDTLAAERRRSAQQVERLRGRLAEARERVRVDDARVDDVAVRLAQMAAELRTALEGTSMSRDPSLLDGQDQPAAQDSGTAVPVPRMTARAGGTAVPVPRTAAQDGPPPEQGQPPARAESEQAGPLPAKEPLAATPGRPCRLPPGLAEDDPLGVEALLRVPGIAIVLDGYNLTKDAAGRPAVALPEQRAWLLALAGGMAARFDRRLTVVFDGTEVRRPSAPVPRGVQLAFSVGDENADDRIVAIVEDLDPDQPVVVVSSDREVRDDCTDLGANVVAARSFLRTARA